MDENRNEDFFVNTVTGQSAYAGYVNSEYGNTGNFFGTNTAPSHPAEKKKSGAFGRIMMSVCMGLLFGLFAGLGFYSVYKIAMKDEVQAVTSESTAQPASALQLDQAQIADLLSGSGETRVTLLTKEETDITEVVADVMPSMVAITEYYTYSSSYWGQLYSQDAEASGSGIIVGETDDEYIIVTNNHVVKEAEDMEVTFIDDTVVHAYLKGNDSARDIAVISVLKKDLDESTKSAIKVAELGDSDSLVLGQNVIAIGNALGYGQSVTTGIVSALDREITTSNGQTNSYIQTDAAINPGNSGGALLNTAGQVIGINSNKIGETTVEGMGYAIPISSVKEIIADLMYRDALIEVNEEDEGYIGIYMQEVTAEISAYYGIPRGIYIKSLVEGGGAEKAGLMAGDIITGFQGFDVDSNASLSKVLKYYAVGDEVTITFMRNVDGKYEEMNVKVTLGPKPE